MIARSAVTRKSPGRYTGRLSKFPFEVHSDEIPGSDCFSRHPMVAFHHAPASAQIVESVGNRALGMGGAFVAVADDSTATWWNPAGHAAGPFFDVTLGWATTDIENDQPPERHDEAAWVAVATPPFGFSYYHLRIAETGQFRTIAADAAGREDRRAAVPDWSLSASQLGATLVTYAGLGSPCRDDAEICAGE